MKILNRYLLREYLIPLGYCLAGFSMVFMLYDLFDHLASIAEAKTPVRLIAIYYASLLVSTFEFLLPASLMLATLYTLWHLTKNHEIVAMKACGRSMYQVMTPFLVVGLIASLLSVILKELVTPGASFLVTSMQKAKFRETDSSVVCRNQAYFNPVDRREWLIDSFTLQEPWRLNGVKIKQERPDGTRAEEITAESAEYLDGQWWFFSPQVQRFDGADNPVGPLVPRSPDGSVREMPFTLEHPDSFASAAKEWEYQSSLEMRRYLETHPNLSPRAKAQKRADMHLRLAMPWACFVVTLFAVPAGAGSRRQTAVTGIFATLAFFMGFYALMQVGLLLAKRQAVAPWIGAWLPNIVFLVAGLVMLRRMR